MSLRHNTCNGHGVVHENSGVSSKGRHGLLCVPAWMGTTVTATAVDLCHRGVEAAWAPHYLEAKPDLKRPLEFCDTSETLLLFR